MILYLYPWLIIALVITGGVTFAFVAAILVWNDERVVYLMPPAMIIFVVFLGLLVVQAIWGENGFILLGH